MHKKLKANLRMCVRSFWVAVLFTVIALAVVVQLGRAAFPILNDYRAVVEAFVSAQVGADVSIGDLNADWRGLTPEISLKNLSVSQNNVVIFSAQNAELEWNLLATLKDWRLGIRKLRFSGLEVEFDQQANGQWKISGLPKSTTAAKSTSGEPIIDDPIDIFIFGRRLELNETRLGLNFRSGVHADITVPQILLENDNRFHRLMAELAVDGEQALNLVVEGYGDPRNESAFTAKGFMQSQGFSGKKIMDGLRESGLIKAGSKVNGILPDDANMNVALWFKGTLQQGVHVLGRAKLDQISAAKNTSVNLPDSVATEFRGYWHGSDGWQVAFNSVSASWADFQTPNNPVFIKGGVGQPLQLQVADVSVEPWLAAIQKINLLPEKAQNVLQTLSPAGLIRSANVELTSPEEGYFKLSANIANGKVNAWQGAPALEGVTGYVEANAFDGHITLKNTTHFTMGFPNIYHSPLEFEQAQGDVRWTLYGLDAATKAEFGDKKWVGVSSGHLVLKGSDYRAQGYLNLRLPFKSQADFEPEMTLSVGVEAAPVSYHKTFVPFVIPDALYQWLDRSVVRGEGRNIAFIYHGTLRGDSDMHRGLQFYADVVDGELAFDQEWPSIKEVSASLLVDDSEVKISGLNGNLLNNALARSSVRLERYSNDDHYLDIRADANGKTQDLLRLLLQSPVRKQLDKSMAQWKASGSYNADVNVRVPLGDKHVQEQAITLHIKNNALHLPDLDLTFTDIKGELTYHHNLGLNAEVLQAQLWQQPIIGSVTTSAYGETKALNILFDGDVAIEKLQRWTKRPELSFATGLAGVSGSIAFPFNADASIIMEAQSDLTGVTLSLPPPYNKKTDEPLSLLFKYLRNKTRDDSLAQSDYWFNLGVSTQLHWQDIGAKIQGITLAFGDTSDAIKPGVFSVAGNIPSLDGLQWYDVLMVYLDRVNDAESSKKNAEPVDAEAVDAELPINVNLAIKDFSLGAFSVSDMSFMGVRNETQWDFNFKSEVLAGSSRVYHAEQPIELNVEYAHIPSSGEGEQRVAPPVILSHTAPAGFDSSDYVSPYSDFYQSSLFADLDIAAVKPINFDIKNFTLGKQQWGAWRFKLRQADGGLIAYDLHANINGLKLEGLAGRGAEMVWLKQDGINKTHFSGVANAGDLGAVIEGLYGEKMLNSKAAHMDIHIEWPGAPDQFDIEHMKGLVSLDVTRGRFMRGATAGENPLLKLMGLLNFDTLARRLRLDFSDLHPEGMAYESIHGELLFDTGTIHIKEPLRVNTPSSQLQMVGDIDLVKERVNAQLVATLPVAGNLTVAAALTGGIPMAVGIYVLGKIFKNQVNKASSIRYNIDGTWENPDVNFDRIFENTVSSNSAKAS